MSDDLSVVRPPLFDEATKNALNLLQDWYREHRVSCNPDGQDRLLAVLIRDPYGRCGVLFAENACFGAGDSEESQQHLDQFRRELRAALGVHALSGDAVALLPDQHVAPEAILHDPDLIPLVEDGRFALLDRLQTNQEWLGKPVCIEPVLPLGVGYSIKGGVGRSTALAMLALSLAREGLKVVVVDLDLEAPGISNMLLAEEDVPSRGVIDWLTEALVEEDPNVFDDLLGQASSRHFFEQFGTLWVIPAAGRETQDYVSKLGRVYLPTFDARAGKIRRLAFRLNQFLLKLKERLDPDLVLLDSRAGLHDMGAAVVTQLGAQVFLFGRDEPQSWNSLKHLLLHLQRSVQVGTKDENQDLRLRLKMVASMMEDFDTSLNRWKEHSYDTWTTLYDSDDTAPFSFAPTDDAAPHDPLVIAFSSIVRKTPLNGPSIVGQWDLLAPSFRNFVDQAIVYLQIRDKV
ncbi:MAG: P-loop NTPase [Magnetococcales bacterium]|nr:P-loop NTPase [Magnetococcales bacterium]